MGIRDDKYKPDGTIDYGARRSKTKKRRYKLIEERKPWERLEKEKESFEAFSCFVKYRDKEPEERDFEKIFSEYLNVNDKDKPNIDKILKWFEKFNWTERAAAWDVEVARVKLVRRRQAVQRMLEQHSKVGSGMIQTAAQELIRLNNRLAEQSTAPLTVAELSILVNTGAKIERLSRDLPTEIEETRQETLDYSKLSDEDLFKIKEIQEKLKK